MRIKIPKRSVLLYMTFFLSILAYLALMIRFNVMDPLYEVGLYSAYAKSIIHDLDLNIINQVPEPMNWLATKNYYHPDFHSIGLTPLLIIFFFLSKIVSFFEPAQTNLFLLAGFSMNVFNFLLTYVSFKKLSEAHEIKFSKLTFLALMTCTASLYFNFLVTNVLESFTLPLVALLLTWYKQFKNHERSEDFLNFTLTAALLVLVKGTNLRLVLPFLLLTLMVNPREKLLSKLGCFLIIVFSYFPHMLFSATKYGNLSSPVAAVSHFFIWSPIWIVKKFWIGYFTPGGMFFVNPVYFLGMISFALFLFSEWKNKKSSWLEAILLILLMLSVIFQFVILPGRTTEVHLPGRLLLVLLPFFYLGLAHVNSLRERWWPFLLAILVPWSVYHLLSFYLMDANEMFSWMSNPLPGLETLNEACTTYKKIWLNQTYYPPFKYITALLISFVLASIIFLLRGLKAKTIIRSLFVLVFGGLFISLALNAVFAPSNIKQLQGQNYFENTVIGDGNEIFFMDYFLDSYQETTQTSDQDMKRMLAERKKKYYSQVRKQVIKTTPEFEAILKSESKDHSFFIK